MCLFEFCNDQYTSSSLNVGALQYRPLLHVLFVSFHDMAAMFTQLS